MVNQNLLELLYIYCHVVVMIFGVILSVIVIIIIFFNPFINNTVWYIIPHFFGFT